MRAAPSSMNSHEQRQHRHYSQLIKRVLERTHQITQHDPSSEGQIRAYELAYPFRHYRMAPWQRWRLYHVFGKGMMATGEYEQAFRYLDSALELAQTYGAPTDRFSLHHDRAFLHRRVGNLVESIGDCTGALDLAVAEPLATGINYVRQQLELLGFVATLEHMLLLPDLAQRHLDQGRKLRDLYGIHGLKDRDLRTLYVAQANLDLFNGYYTGSRAYAERAAAFYLAEQDLLSFTRIHMIYCESQVRLAESTVDPRRRKELCADAARAIERGRLNALKADDRIGFDLMTIADVRLSRITQRDEDRLERLERLLHATSDLVLQIMALTGIGDELLARGATTQALDVYAHVISITEGTELASYGAVARREYYSAYSMMQ